MGDGAAAIAERLLLTTDHKKEVQIFPHVRVDGDCLGSAAALAMALNSLHIHAKVYMDETIPERLAFIGIDPVLLEIYDPKKLDEYYDRQGEALAVDCSEASRMGLSGALFEKAEQKLVIDKFENQLNMAWTRICSGSYRRDCCYFQIQSADGYYY